MSMALPYLLSATHPDCILPFLLASIDMCFSPLMSSTFSHVTTITDAQGLDKGLKKSREMFYFLIDQCKI